MLEQVMKIILYCYIELRPELDDRNKILSWSVFGCKTGGCWGHGDTIFSAVAIWLYNNRDDYKQICPGCASIFEHVRILKATKGVCSLCGSGNSHSFVMEVL